MHNVLGLVALALLVWLLIQLAPWKRRVLYIDTGSSAIFVNSKYNISAKPDSILNRQTIEEYKNRSLGIYDSDRAQMIATALAVRTRYPVVKGVLVTNEKHYAVDLSGRDDELYKIIEDDISQILKLREGRPPRANPSIAKCSSCPHKNRCEFQKGVAIPINDAN